MNKELKRFLQITTAIIGFCFLIALAHAVSALTLDRTIQYKDISYASAKIKPELDGYTIVFITDTHRISDAKLKAAVERINERPIDLLVLGGDFNNGILNQHLAILSKTKTSDGIYSVMGNHDLYKSLNAALPQYGITFLYNRGLQLKPGFFLAGVSDLRTHKPNVNKALQGTLAGDFVLLLSHNPALALEHDVSSVDLMLSGHTHGGQVNLFGLWSPAMAYLNPYGNQLRSGWHRAGGIDVFVSNGIGSQVRVPRVFARPQVIFLTLHSQTEGD